MVERVIVSAQITATEHEQLQRMANVADRSLSAEIRRALRSYLEQGNEREVYGEVPIASRRTAGHMAKRLKSKTKSREAHGYGPSHRMRRRMLSARVEAGLEYCARCGEPILQGEPWDLGHDDYDRRLYLGPEHRRCNRSAAGKNSAELQRCKTSREW